MTRETKIGLLVGLAFIIVIGVLLSDYIQSSTQPQQADFVATTQTLRQGVEVPGTVNGRAGPVQPPVTVEPSAIIVTQDFLSSGTRQPDAQIRIGPGVISPAPAPATPAQPLVIGPPSGNPLVPLQAEGPSTQGAVVVTPERSAEAELARLLVIPAPAGSTPAATRETTSAGARTHTAVAGDTVYKMAQRYYGGFTPSRAELIVRANPSMGGRADRIVVGQTYVIPPLPGENASAAAATPPAPAPAATTPRPEPRPASSYTVRPGDSLWRIADRTGVSVAELKQANRDTLRGSDVVRPGMVLRLPGNAATAAAD